MVISKKIYKKRIKASSLRSYDSQNKREHCGPNLDDTLGYRPDEFLKKWEENDIIKKYRKYIILNNYESEKLSQKLKTL